MDSYDITFNAWNKAAAAYENKFMELDLYNHTYEAFCKLVPNTTARILEIGCGPGNITNYLLQHRPDYQLLATDVAPDMLALAKRNNPTIETQQLDARNLHVLQGKFDGIVIGFCLPYLSQTDAAKLFKDCANLLHENGMLYLSAIEGDSSRSGYETGSNPEFKMYVYYHQETALRQQLENNQFEVLAVEKIAYHKTSEVTDTHLVIIARKQPIKSY
ncbi:MAG: class I SAM-dependent methyltransferase [Bacteroidetes bacterium]|nr:MAG: class I SAM-dependent methyltransferase [Bacteroidota bacterium]